MGGIGPTTAIVAQQIPGIQPDWKAADPATLQGSSRELQGIGHRVDHLPGSPA
jgi:hypothetical protein